MGTEQYSDLESAKKSSSDGKSLVAAAITQMGVSTAATVAFSVMAGNIRKIKVYKEYNVAILSTSNTLPFLYGDTSVNFYYVEKKLSFTPMIIRASHDKVSGNNVIVNLPGNKNYWYTDAGTEYGNKFIKISGNAYFNSTGFRLPVKYAASSYSILVIGY